MLTHNFIFHPLSTPQGIVRACGSVLNENNGGIRRHLASHSPYRKATACNGVGAGYKVSCAIRGSDGHAKCWGSNEDDGGSPPSPQEAYSAIAVGGQHNNKAHGIAIRASDSRPRCVMLCTFLSTTMTGIFPLLSDGSLTPPLPRAPVVGVAIVTIWAALMMW